MDPIATFKTNQKAAWAGFAQFENITATSAPRLVGFAGIGPGNRVLDVACGTGVVALTAARAGARVTGIDLTPELVARARDNSSLMGLEVEWHEGDAEALPFADGQFDVVVSQFGHMFAPRPTVAISEMLRVLRSGGTIAFATWPPELFVGRMFELLGRFGPPAPADAVPPSAWGDPHVVRERLGGAANQIVFDRATMLLQALSVQHYRVFMEQGGPAQRLLAGLDRDDPPRAAALRRELEALTGEYFHDNTIRQDYLLTRATKA